jgi:hypothetical protein
VPVGDSPTSVALSQIWRPLSVPYAEVGGRSPEFRQQSVAPIAAAKRRAERQIWRGCGSAAGLLDAVDVPWLRNALEVVNTAIGEREPGTGDEIDDGPRDENLARNGER